MLSVAVSCVWYFFFCRFPLLFDFSRFVWREPRELQWKTKLKVSWLACLELPLVCPEMEGQFICNIDVQTLLIFLDRVVGLFGPTCFSDYYVPHLFVLFFVFSIFRSRPILKVVGFSLIGVHERAFFSWKPFSWTKNVELPT